MKTSSLKTISVKDRDGIPGIITYGLHYLEGNQDAYFSVTAWFKEGQYGGCCHETILDLCPELKPLIDLHLSSEDGWPMPLYANAESHAGIGKWSKFAPRWLASHLRISDEAADDLANSWSLDKSQKLREFIDSQIPRYEREAKEAIKNFQLR